VNGTVIKEKKTTVFDFLNKMPSAPSGAIEPVTLKKYISNHSKELKKITAKSAF
jgi:hypothetical protein